MGAEPVFVGEMINCKLRLETLKGKAKQAIGVGWDGNEEVGNNQLQWVDVDGLSGVEVLLTQIANRRGFFILGKSILKLVFRWGCL
ncbi:hypothetical protein DKL61_13675 [Gammaproteobacteria bacterium ESL0073]|nr:hypothetical protein DKL61_13675 [Gammaproteobacteria bacterium ESL0073]